MAHFIRDGVGILTLRGCPGPDEWPALCAQCEEALAQLGAGGLLLLPASTDEDGRYLWDFQPADRNDPNIVLRVRRES